MNANDISVLILAGGKGTRIAALNPHLPKPMVPAAGQPFLEWVLRYLLQQKIQNFVLSIGHMAEVIEEWVPRRTTVAQETIRFHREATPLGTGGAIADALPHITTPICVVMNGDSLFLADLSPALQRLQAEGLDGILLARIMADTGRYGRLDVQNGMLRGFAEKQPGSGLINGGVYVFRTEWLRKHLPEGVSSLEQDIFPRWLAAGAKIGVAECAAPFIDIGTPETLVQTSNFITEHKDYFA